MNYQKVEFKPDSLAVTEDIFLKLGGVYGVINWQYPNSEYSSMTNGQQSYKRDKKIDRERELFCKSEVIVFPPIYQRIHQKFRYLAARFRKLLQRINEECPSSTREYFSPLLHGNDAHLRMQYLQQKDPHGLSRNRLDSREIPYYNQKLWKCYENVTELLVRPNVTVIQDGMSMGKRWDEFRVIKLVETEKMLMEARNGKLTLSHAQFLLLCRLFENYNVTVFSNNETVKTAAFRHKIPFVEFLQGKAEPYIMRSSSKVAPEIQIPKKN